MAATASKKAQKNKKKDANGNFARGVKAELKKVIWPTKKELINYTVMVIACTIVVMAIMAVSDLVFPTCFGCCKALSDRRPAIDGS